MDMATIKTRLHLYNFESPTHPKYKQQLDAIKANAEGRGHWMHAWGGPSTAKDVKPGRSHAAKLNTVTTEEVEIDLAHVFDNQWNEAGEGGRRLFDHYEEYTDRQFRRGHWLEITPEMAEARRVTLKCGYCGCQYGPHHKPAPEPVVEGGGAFCLRCLDNEYLKPEELHLLRLAPVAEDDKRERAKLTEDERAVLMPLYVTRQTTGNDSRAKKRRDNARADGVKKFEKETAAATTERDGMLWLWDHNVSLDNVIYYSHTGKFSFGWRSPLSDEVASAFLDLLCEFPFPYELVTAKGKKVATVGE
jgi:hypothetical protein